MRADEFAIGVGFDERVLVRRDGIELDGSVYLHGKRQLIVQRRVRLAGIGRRSGGTDRFEPEGEVHRRDQPF